jgi:hypothetical protein
MKLHVCTLAIGSWVVVVDLGPSYVEAVVFDGSKAVTWESPVPVGVTPEDVLVWVVSLALDLGASGDTMLLRPGLVSSEKAAVACVGAGAIFIAKTTSRGECVTRH